MEENNNPFQAPEADLEIPTDPSMASTYIGPQSRPTGSGVNWISSGYQNFKASPGPWLVTMLVGFVIMILISIIPIIGSLVQMFTTYVWMGGLMLGCQAVSQGEKMDVNYLFAGFKNKFGQLLGLSVLVGLVSIAIVFIFVGKVYFDLMFAGADTVPESFDFMSFMLNMLIVFALMIPLFMAVWFAPALIVLQDMPVVAAMKASFFGCLKNILPFLVYGVVMFVLMIIAALPLFLGFLVVVPIAYASIHAAYQDIYLKSSENDL
ncbi:BPSS1780 family membrane protein [Agaribacter flavus]|uniref:BPSS1780 family membrane protein n=1 Tax=Agaribacter flavus TaxID=1902781 RepID=A0ABV7FIM7_9ALTE